ncbi:HMG box [Teladorsagia circumcincta]|uniref:HMG box n=1 Tax=Teladorsagia circumcincta TaxID=45464 RepID=A0A2G9US16_TELCI|nr:HMG box [Teladorsagia circumcincta]
MSVSSHSSGAGSRVGSPEDENGNSRSQLPASPTTAKQDRFADLKRRSAYAFSIFANEEREKLMKTHPDLPMGLVTRMMVEKWKGLDTEAKMPYFEAARTSPLKTKKPVDSIPEVIPAKKLRPIIPYTKIALPVNDQPIRVETVTEQQPGKIIFVQGRVNPVPERSKIGYPSSISASIAHALGMPIAVQSQRRSPSVVTRVSPPPLRTAAVRARPAPTVVPSQQITAAPVSAPALPADTEVRPQTTNSGFATSQQALDMFYLALCEPAFPHPNEPPLTPYPANYCYDEYLRMTSGQGPL